MKDLDLKVTEDRINDVPLETFYGVNSNPRNQIDFIAHFVVDEDGNYMQNKGAVKAVTSGRTIGDLETITKQLIDAMENTAVPKG